MNHTNAFADGCCIIRFMAFISSCHLLLQVKITSYSIAIFKNIKITFTCNNSDKTKIMYMYRTILTESRLSLQPVWVVGGRMKFYKANNALGECPVCITK